METRIHKKWDKKREFEFRKSDIYNPAVGVGLPDFDPYPTHRPDDVVERRVIGNEFFIEGELVSDDPVQIGLTFEIDNLRYTVISLIEDVGMHTSKTKAVFVASHVEAFVQPLQLLESIRKEKLTKQTGSG
jgi:hypothetical protein